MRGEQTIIIEAPEPVLKLLGDNEIPIVAFNSWGFWVMFGVLVVCTMLIMRRRR